MSVEGGVPGQQDIPLEHSEALNLPSIGHAGAVPGQQDLTSMLMAGFPGSQAQMVADAQQLPQMGLAGLSPGVSPVEGMSGKRKSSSGKDPLIERREKNRVAASASRARKKEYVQNLEKAIHVLTTEKLELQVKVATLTNQLWEQSIKIDELEKALAEIKGYKLPPKDEGAMGPESVLPPQL
eukprot:m51a1_g7335 hypothetical protein (182) ;mRNA; f:190936-191988